MITGIGVDIVSVAKIQRAVERWGEAFLTRVFDKSELVPLARGKVYYQRLAARFAAKEAVIKALGKIEILALRDILISNLPGGAPVCNLRKDVGYDIIISLSHIEEYAVATAFAQPRSANA